VKLSGALPADQVRVLRSRVAKLIDAVKIAREAANMTLADDRQAGTAVFGYLFG
jgi:hypothetical protein